MNTAERASRLKRANELTNEIDADLAEAPDAEDGP